MGHIKKNGKTDKMKLFAFLALSVLVGASAIPSENRPQANSFLKREKRQNRSEYWEEKREEAEESRETRIRCLRTCTDIKWVNGRYKTVIVPCNSSTCPNYDDSSDYSSYYENY